MNLPPTPRAHPRDLLPAPALSLLGRAQKPEVVNRRQDFSVHLPGV